MSDNDDWAEKQAEIEEAWRQPAFSHETIAADAWTAVYLPIPVDADRELLEHARGRAADLQCYADPEIQNPNALNAFDAPLSGPAESHSLAQHCEAAGARCAEITTRIARLDVNDLSRDAEGTAEAAETMQSPMTVEAIARDPWNAVVLDLPENGTRELYVAAADAAHMLRSIPEAEMPAPPFPLPTNDLEWSALGDEIKSRMKDAGNKIHDIDVAAGRAEVMGMIAVAEHEDLKAWAEDWIDSADLEEAQGYTTEARQRLEQYQPTPGEFANLDAFMSATEHLARETMTLEAIERDPLKAITLDLPKNADVELLRAVDDLAWSVVEKATARAAAAASPDEKQQWDILADKAFARGDDAHEKLVTALEAAHVDNAAEVYATRIRDAEETAVVAPSQPVPGFLLLSDTVDNLRDATMRTVHMMLGAVIGFFVDEPKMTAQQVHDTLQAAGNVETLHAREYAAGEAVEADAHDFRMMTMKGAQQEHDLRLAMTLGTNPTAEANMGLDEHEASRSNELSL